MGTNDFILIITCVCSTVIPAIVPLIVRYVKFTSRYTTVYVWSKLAPRLTKALLKHKDLVDVFFSSRQAKLMSDILRDQGKQVVLMRIYRIRKWFTPSTSKGVFYVNKLSDINTLIDSFIINS